MTWLGSATFPCSRPRVVHSWSVREPQLTPAGVRLASSWTMPPTWSATREPLGDRQGVHVGAVDDRGAVGPVLGHRHPQRPVAVDVDATRVMDVAPAEGDVSQQVPGAVEDQAVPDAATGGAVVTVHRDGVARGRLDVRRASEGGL